MSDERRECRIAVLGHRLQLLACSSCGRQQFVLPVYLGPGLQLCLLGSGVRLCQFVQLGCSRHRLQLPAHLLVQNCLSLLCSVLWQVEVGSTVVKKIHLYSSTYNYSRKKLRTWK